MLNRSALAKRVSVEDEELQEDLLNQSSVAPKEKRSLESTAVRRPTTMNFAKRLKGYRPNKINPDK